MIRLELLQQHGAHFGVMFPLIINLFNESQLADGKSIQIRDTAVLTLAIRIYTISQPGPLLTPQGANPPAIPAINPGQPGAPSAAQTAAQNALAQATQGTYAELRKYVSLHFCAIHFRIDKTR